MFPVCPILSHGHGNADVGLHFHFPTYVVPLETAALVESRKDTLQHGALIAALMPGSGVTRCGREDSTVLAELGALDAAVLGDLSAVLLVTFPTALTVQSIDHSRTARFQGLSIFYQLLTIRCHNQL